MATISFVIMAILTGDALAASPNVPTASPASANVDLEGMGGGLHVYQISGRVYGVNDPIHILTFSGAHFGLQIDLAHHAIDGGRQTPGDMCRSTLGCVAAVNGDYFDLTPRGVPDPGDAVGGIIQGCVLLHTPEIAHQQADFESHTVSEGLNWHAVIDANGVLVPITAINQELPLSYAKVRLPLSGTLLYGTPYALALPTRAGRVIDEFSYTEGSPMPTTINTTSQLVLVDQTQSSVRVRPGLVDVSVAIGSPLAELQMGQTVTLTTTSTSGCDNIGGHPILLNHGVPVPVSPVDSFMARPYARTVIGWTATGDTVVVVVDGRDGASGATAVQLVKLLQSLNVVTALNLDGGASTTLYARGRVLSRPSHRTSRLVSTALLVVRK